MTRPFVPAFAAASLISGSLISGSALAFDYVEIGFGVLGNFGANFIDQPTDQLVLGKEVKPEYPGFSGDAVGGGPMIELRFFQYVGVELDFFYQKDFGTTEITITNTTTGAQNVFEIEIGQSAWHLPLLFKGAFLPDEPVQPTFGIGPEFVLPGDTTSEIISGSNTTKTQYGAYNLGSYTRLAIAFGIEARLPLPTEEVSLRIPIQIRGSFHTGLEDTRAAREDTALDPAASPPAARRIAYLVEWEYQVGASFGLAMHF
jgi:hypothetical protein